MSNYDVFISYSRKDDADQFVTRMKVALEAAGLRVWMDDKIVSSAEWWAQIETHIERSHNFLLFISEHSLASEWCQKEIAHAFDNGKRLIAFQLSAIDEKRVKGSWMDTSWEQIARANWEPLRKVQWIADHLGVPDFPAAVERIRADAQTDPAYVEAHTRLLLQAQTWQNSGESPGAHISGEPLTQAEAWLTAWDGKTLPAPTELQRAFVSACRAAQEAAEQEAAAKETRARRLRRLSLVAVFVGALAIALGVIAGATAITATHVSSTAVAEAIAQNQQLNAARAEGTQLAVTLAAIPPTLDAVATRVQAGENRITSLDLASDAVTILNQPSANFKLAALLGIRALQTDYTAQADSVLQRAAEGLLTNVAARGVGCGMDSAASSPDRGFILVASRNDTVRFWDTLTWDKSRILVGHESSVSSAAYSPDGRFIITASYDRTARIWDAATGDECKVLRGHGGYVYSAAYSPDGRFIVTASADGTVRIWSAVTGDEIWVLRGHERGVISAAYSPDGRFIVTASADGTACIWSAETGEEIQVLRGHESSVNSAAYSPDGRFIVTASADGTAHIWSAETGEEIHVLRGHESSVNSAAYSPDGRFIVTAGGSGPFSGAAGRDNTARIWEAATGNEIRVLRGHEEMVISATYSPDGRFIITTSSDYTARIWDTETGELIRILGRHDSIFTSAVYSHDRRFILTASEDGTARIWDATVEDFVAYACTRVSRDFTDEERARYGIDDTPTCPQFGNLTP